MIERPVDRKFAQQLEGEVEFGNDNRGPMFTVRVGDAPVALPLRRILGELSSHFESRVSDDYELWLIPHQVAINRNYGLHKITSLGIEVKFSGGQQTCSVAGLIPDFSFVRIANIGTVFSGNLDIAVAANPTVATKIVEVNNLTFGLDAKGKLSVSCELGVSLPRISASGQGSTISRWDLPKDEPLFGRTVTTHSIVALPRGKRQIRMQISVYVVHRLLFVPTRWDIEPVTLRCKLSP